jgi:hypothetical protein
MSALTINTTTQSSMNHGPKSVKANGSLRSLVFKGKGTQITRNSLTRNSLNFTSSLKELKTSKNTPVVSPLFRP